ncbi:MAG: 16S rRNA (guanine527-N7)-methyltransferase [Bradymonadia bacterium]|jgi:16S rRNA (guanine527-N7)-methyltransferase
MNAADLQRALETAGLDLQVSKATVANIEAYLALRKRWSRTHNLAGPQAKADPWRVDVVDSLAVLGALDPELPLIDVGAGSGTPGLILAIARPEHPICLVESLTKRVAFLRTAIHHLGLQNVTVQRSRWPVSLDAPCQVISRAVVSPAKWPALAASGGPQVRSILRCLAAQRPPAELADFECAMTVPYDLGESGSRQIERWDRRISNG